MAIRYAVARQPAPLEAHDNETRRSLIDYLRGLPSEPCTLKQVIDGDTIWILPGPRRVRLAGIDNPETRKPGHPPQQAGFMAATALRSILRDHALEFRSDPRQPRLDSYGRLLGYIRILPGWEDAGDALLRAGWAWPTPWHSPLLRPVYQQDLRYALAAQLGLWSPACPVPRGAHADRILKHFAQVSLLS